MSKQEFKGIGKFSIVIIDLLLLHFGYILSYIIKFGFHPPQENLIPYYVLIPIITLVSIIILNIYNLYSISMKSYEDTIFSIVLSMIILQLFTMASTFFVRQFAFPRTIIFISFFIQVALLSLWRCYLLRLYKKIHGNKVIMIVGEHDDAEEFAKNILLNSKEWYDIRYIIKPEEFLNVKNYLNDVNSIYLCTSIDENLKSQIYREALERKKEIFVVPRFRDILLLKSEIVQFDDVPVIKVSYPELTTEQKFIKRFFDILIGLIVFILASPIMIISAILVKATSKGPILFKQVRFTEGYKKFEIYKFRSMCENAEAKTGPVLASDGDERITKIGNFLRATRIDELPQIFNVLKGDMSFIGPRPERPFFVKQFEKEYPTYKYRHNVKAGITGLAQVMGKYSTNVQDKLTFDLIYIKNYSILLDFKILLLTIKVALTKEAASGLKGEMELNEILKSLNYSVYNETGVTKFEK